MNQTEETSGSCLCGALEFSVKLPVKWCVHCHCTRCRRSHGSGFVTWFGVDKEQFTLEKGEESLKWYHSSEKSEYGFCINCGSSILFRSAKWPDEIHITLSNVSPGIGMKPRAHVYFDTHVEWLEFDDGMDRRVDPGKSD